ncbi:MAG: M23 family metallopeptidase [Alphaproteobacteria bacterium]|nr:M23 family metallopeptidase [Alphaproteobacteria bacterium]
MKKRFVLTFFFFLLSACSFDSGRIRLFNYNIWGVSAPSSIRVQKGDTLYNISRRYDVPMREVIELNHLRPPYNLNVGQIIRLPAAKYHVVQKGDTLYSLSRRYNVDVTSLSRNNHITAPYVLNVGQKLVLPDSVVDSNYPLSSKTNSNDKSDTSKRWSWSSSSKTNTTKYSRKISSKPESKNRKISSAQYTSPPINRKTKFAWPVSGKILSPFGRIGKGRNNDGINIKAAKGTSVKAADSGTIAYAGNELKGFGNLILIKHNDGWITAYAHNDKLLVRKGQRVRRGEKIATVGTTGGVNTPQLHFEIRRGKKPVNPKSYLP